MKEIPIVILKPKDGKKAKITGEKALAAIEAIKAVLEDRNVPEMCPLQVDLTFPKNFSLAQATAMAISLGYQNPKEIADCIQREIERHL